MRNSGDVKKTAVVKLGGNLAVLKVGYLWQVAERHPKDDFSSIYKHIYAQEFPTPPVA